jgi:hypothetical protein
LPPGGRITKGRSVLLRHEAANRVGPGREGLQNVSDSPIDAGQLLEQTASANEPEQHRSAVHSAVIWPLILASTTGR